MSLASGAPTGHDRVSVYAVDDDREYLEVFRVAAGSFSPLILKTFSQTTKFFEALTTNPITDFVLFFIDIRLGSTGGFELCEHVRSHALYGCAPVIIMSSSLLQEDVNKSFRLGASSYFYKPAGTQARVEAIRRQLTYWLDDAKLPYPEREAARERAPLKSQAARSNNLKMRGKPLYAIERLRQDILVSLLTDLKDMSGQKIPDSTIDRLKRTLTRLQEIFQFSPDLFNKDIVNTIREYCDNINMWIDAISKIPSSKKAFALQEEYIQKAKDARKAFGKALSKIKTDGATEEIYLRLDSWIWDVFNELANGPTFPELYISLKRFQSRAF
jgi:CheY-like chemotaxis protein